MKLRTRVAAAFAGAAVVFGALASTACAQSPARAAAAPAQTASPGGGVDLIHAKASFQSLCSKCHDLGLATSQAHDRAGWNEVVQRMSGFGLVASDEEKAEVVEYLAASHPASQ